MAYSKGTMAQGGTSASGTALTCSPTYLAHDVAWVVVTYGTGSAITETVTDGVNTYVKLGSTVVDGPNGQCMAQFYCKDCAAGTPTVSFNLASASTERGMFVLPIHGLDNTVTPVGGGQLQSAPGSANDAVSSGNITPPGQPAFFGGLVLNTSDFTTTFTGGTGFVDDGGISTWTSGGSNAALPPCRYEDTRITSTSPKAATFKASVGSNQNIVMAFTAPEAATTTPISSRIRKNTIHPGRHPNKFGRHNRLKRDVTQGIAVVSQISGSSAGLGSSTANLTGDGALGGASAGLGLPTGSLVYSQTDTASRRSRPVVHPGRGPYNFVRFKRSKRDTSAIVLLSGALQGSSAGLGSSTANLIGLGALAGVGAGIASSVATLSLIGSSAGVGSSSSVLTGDGALSGASSGIGVSTGTMDQGAIHGSASGSGTATGYLSLIGSSAGIGSATGTTLGAGALAGSSAGSASSVAYLQLWASASGLASSNAGLTGSGALSGTSAGVGSNSTTLIGSGALAGSSAGVATAQLSLAGAISGSTSGSGIASASIGGSGSLVSSSSGAGSCSGALGGSGSLNCSASGASTASAAIHGDGSLVGVSAAVAQVLAVLFGTAAIVGSANGHGTATLNSAYSSGDIPATLAHSSHEFGEIEFSSHRFGQARFA